MARHLDDFHVDEVANHRTHEDLVVRDILSDQSISDLKSNGLGS